MLPLGGFTEIPDLLSWMRNKTTLTQLLVQQQLKIYLTQPNLTFSLHCLKKLLPIKLRAVWCKDEMNFRG